MSEPSATEDFDGVVRAPRFLPIRQPPTIVTVPCKTCGRTGKLAPPSPAMWSGTYTPLGMDRCLTCDGTGWVKIQASEWK